ncbi:MAG: MFS transporter [Rubrobacteraceae bacterium]|nr:MFS transporter [Rubrobacteraceae bacterium]MDQ3436694.1 MFS transporter [Actinomycetota bacterium]
MAPGLALIAVTYGLARFAYGLFLPEMREAFDLSPSLLGAIGAGSYLAYCVAVVISLVFTSRTGPRWMAVAAGTAAVVGMAVVAGAPAPWVLALGIVVGGSSTGLASPPMGEAVARTIRDGLQDRANALINSGTSVGVALSGPAALLLSGQWRLAWVAFALVGLAVLAWNAAVMPREAVADQDEDGAEAGDGSGRTRLSFSYLVGARVRSRSLPLFVSAFGLGFASAVYWTFSRDLVVQVGGLGQTGSTLFWTVIGVSGLAGGAAGDLVRRFGLAAVLRGALVSMAGSMALLAVAPGVLPLAYASAALFGSTYILLTGVVLVWSVGVFRERPSAGLGAGFLLIAVGQVVGSPVAGALAGTTSPTTAFFSFAGVAVLTALVRPHSDLQGLQVRE